jgi:hypothetical protein
MPTSFDECGVNPESRLAMRGVFWSMMAVSVTSEQAR